MACISMYQYVSTYLFYSSVVTNSVQLQCQPLFTKLIELHLTGEVLSDNVFDLLRHETFVEVLSHPPHLLELLFVHFPCS